MAYWLMKSEPGEFSIDDLRASPGRTTCWDGVRNYQARNYMRDDMKVGDLVFFYHSNCPQAGIAGIAEVAKSAYADHTAFDPNDKHYDPKSTAENPRWYMVDIRFKSKFKRIVGLQELRAHADGELRRFPLLRRGNRLSVLPLTKEQWSFIVRLARADTKK